MNKESIDMKKVFEEEIQKPYYDVFYLDKFKLPYEKLDVSVIIVTYNRSPYKTGTFKESLNPLKWAIKSALMQKPKLKEIIVVNDKSTDFTDDLVKKMIGERKEADPPIIYIKNKERVGPDISRNEGVKKSTAKYIHFVDDDCFITPYSSFGAVYTFENLEKKGIRVGMVNLPTYTRSSKPRIFVLKKEIGSISFLEGTYKSNKDALPLEYLQPENHNEKFMNGELNILNPFPIFNINSTSLLCSKKAFVEVGGFPEVIIKRMGDREFGCRIIENGYSVYFQPDIKFHCVHGLYGLSNGQEFAGNDWLKKEDK